MGVCASDFGFLCFLLVSIDLVREQACCVGDTCCMSICRCCVLVFNLHRKTLRCGVVEHGISTVVAVKMDKMAYQYFIHWMLSSSLSKARGELLFAFFLHNCDLCSMNILFEHSFGWFERVWLFGRFFWCFFFSSVLFSYGFVAHLKCYVRLTWDSSGMSFHVWSCMFHSIAFANTFAGRSIGKLYLFRVF